MSKHLTEKNNHIYISNIRQNTLKLSLVRRLRFLICHPKHILAVIKIRILCAAANSQGALGYMLTQLSNSLQGRGSVIDWDSRVDELGAYSVIDSKHSPDEFEYVTKRQKEILYPYFLSSLNGHEQSVLDFGCGAGRFTSELAEMINGKSVGIDFSQKLIDICPPNKNVTYMWDEKSLSQEY